MKIETKHNIAIEQKDFLQSTLESDFKKIESDISGACWHIQEVKEFATQEAIRIDGLPIEEKQKLPFYGLTVGVKDLFCIKGLHTTAGSKILENFISPYDSEVWSSLKSKGVLLTSKLAMDEFAMGSFSDTSYLGKVSIPTHLDRTAGGSSGGSAAALVADLADFTVGSDTGGSVRLPASYCSLVGYKPSYGAFSRYGMIAYASSLDQAGFMTKTVEDLDYLLKAGISTKDVKDTTSIGLGEYKETSTISKVGYFPEFLEEEGISEDVKIAYQKTLDSLKESGHQLEPIKIDYMREAAHIYYIIACSETSSNLARYQGVYFGKKLIEEQFEGSFWQQAAQYRSKYFGAEVQKRIMLGSYVLSSENYDSMYKKAILLRGLLKQSFELVFSKVDMLVLPVSPAVAPKWTEIETMTTAEIYMADYMTVPFSLAGLPAVSLPLHTNNEGLGIGMQFVGKYLEDYRLVQHLRKISL